MTTTTECSQRGCTRLLRPKQAVTLRDGRQVCSHHGDHMPPYLRRPARPTKKATP